MHRLDLKGTNTHHNGQMGKKKNQTGIMVEIYSKSLVRAMGITNEIYLEHQLKPIKVMENGLCL